MRVDEMALTPWDDVDITHKYVSVAYLHQSFLFTCCFSVAALDI